MSAARAARTPSRSSPAGAAPTHDKPCWADTHPDPRRSAGIGPAACRRTRTGPPGHKRSCCKRCSYGCAGLDACRRRFEVVRRLPATAAVAEGLRGRSAAFKPKPRDATRSRIRLPPAASKRLRRFRWCRPMQCRSCRCVGRPLSRRSFRHRTRPQRASKPKGVSEQAREREIVPLPGESGGKWRRRGVGHYNRHA